MLVETVRPSSAAAFAARSSSSEADPIPGRDAPDGAFSSRFRPSSYEHGEPLRRWTGQWERVVAVVSVESQSQGRRPAAHPTYARLWLAAGECAVPASRKHVVPLPTIQGMRAATRHVRPRRGRIQERHENFGLTSWNDIVSPNAPRADEGHVGVTLDKAWMYDGTVRADRALGVEARLQFFGGSDGDDVAAETAIAPSG
jgi:hypothetical protein